MIRLTTQGNLSASPNPTTLDPERRIELRLNGLYSTSPPEMADFEYFSDRLDVEIEEGQPAKRRERIDWGKNASKEVAHRIVLRKVPGTDPPLAPVRLKITGPNGESATRGVVIGIDES